MNRYLLLHGFAGSHSSFDAFTQLLPPSATVCALNLLGHAGLSDTAAVPKSFEQQVELLLEDLERRDRASSDSEAEPWHVVGYSLGGRVALGMALAQAERSKLLVGRATLVGVNPGLAEEVDRQERLSSDEAWADRIETEGVADFLEAWRAQALFASQAGLPDEVLKKQQAIALNHDPSRLAQAMRTLSLGRMPYYGDALEALGRRPDAPGRMVLDWWQAV